MAAATSYQGLPLGCPRGFHKRFVRTTVEPLPAAAVHRSICQEDLAGQSSPVGCQAGRADKKPVKTAVAELFFPPVDLESVTELTRTPKEIALRGSELGYFSSKLEGRRAVLAGRTTVAELRRVQSSLRLGSEERGA